MPSCVGTVGGPVDPVELATAQQRYTAFAGVDTQEDGNEGPDEGIAAVHATYNLRHCAIAPTIGVICMI